MLARNREWFGPLVLALALALGSCSQPRTTHEPSAPIPTSSPRQATIPLRIEGNRPFVDLTLRGPDGKTRTATFLVDSGGGGFLILESAARDLGLSWGAPMSEGGSEFAALETVPQALAGDFALKLTPERTLVLLGRDNLLPPAAPGHADGMLPGHVLSQYHVVFDYPRGTFTIAEPGELRPSGDALPMPVSRRSGFPRTELEIDGTPLGFLLDTGASFTMVSEVQLKQWGDAHPDWQRSPGAAGEATTLGGQTLETMIVPSARWGNEAIADLGVVSQREGVFEGWMSSMMTAPIVGALAGNVLKQFRVELDYPNEKLYLSKP